MLFYIKKSFSNIPNIQKKKLYKNCLTAVVAIVNVKMIYELAGYTTTTFGTNRKGIYDEQFQFNYHISQLELFILLLFYFFFNLYLSCLVLLLLVHSLYFFFYFCCNYREYNLVWIYR